MPVEEAQKRLNDLEDLLKKSPELQTKLPCRPEEPLTSDCCGQSCQPCVYDLYRCELDDWTKRSWRRLNGKNENDDDEEEEKILKQKLEDGKQREEKLFSFQPNVYQSLKLLSITPTTENTNIYRFALPSPDQRFFLPIGTHVIMKGYYETKTKSAASGDNKRQEQISNDPSSAKKENQKSVQQLMTVVRQYTPILDTETRGVLDLMIKVYPFGKMSSFLRRIQKEFESGHEVKAEFRGPYGLFTYDANQYADLLMFAAGTGLAPMAQIIEHILRDEDVDMTRIRLLFCCRRYDEILLKDRLEDWRRRWNFSVCYVLSQWREETDRRLAKYGEEIVAGTRLDQHRVTEEVKRLQSLEHLRIENANANLSSTLPPAYQVLICGTKSFEKDVMNYLLKAGVMAKRIFRF